MKLDARQILKGAAITLIIGLMAGRMFFGYGYGLFHDTEDVRSYLESEGYEVVSVSTGFGLSACDDDWQLWDATVIEEGQEKDIEVCVGGALVTGLTDPEYIIYGDYD